VASNKTLKYNLPLYCDLRIFKDNVLGKSRWLMFVILTTWEAEIRRIVVPGQSRPKRNVCETLSQWKMLGMCVITVMAGSIK
jgi:hypothetical protein